MIRKPWIALAASFAAISSPALANATKAVVVYDKGCSSRMIMYTSLGYILAEWYGGNTPEKGDVVVGDLNSYGFKDVWNLTKDAASRVYVDDYLLSKDRVIEKLSEKCN